VSFLSIIFPSNRLVAAPPRLLSLFLLLFILLHPEPIYLSICLQLRSDRFNGLRFLHSLPYFCWSAPSWSVAVPRFLLSVYFPTSCGSAVVKALCYKLKGRGFENRWAELIFSIYLTLPAALAPGVYSASNKYEYRKQKYNVPGE
jgi:hypothetical protein